MIAVSPPNSACRPMPGPPGAAWPSARPGAGYCGPYPQCCPHAAARAGLLGWMAAHPLTGPIAVFAVAGVIAVVIAATLQARERRRLRGEG